MDKKQIQKIINGVILFIFGIFEMILLIRILLKIIGASTESSFVEFWYNLSSYLFSPFDRTLTDISSGNIVIELNSIIAASIFVLITLLIIKVVSSIFADNFNEQIKRLFDSLFKIIVAILGLRLLFKLVGASKSGFIAVLYGISAVFYEPFKGILPTIGQGKIVFETSTFIAIIIFVILDYASDRLLKEIFKDSGTVPTQKPIQPTTSPQTPTQSPSPSQPAVQTPQIPGQAPQQVGQAPQVTGQAPAPTVNVITTPQAPPQQQQSPQSNVGQEQTTSGFQTQQTQETQQPSNIQEDKKTLGEQSVEDRVNPPAQ